MRFGFAKEDITPKRGIGLCGYFEPRPNKGAYDSLNIRAALFECGGKVGGIVSYDLCLFGRALVEKFMAAVQAAGMDFARDLLYSATHTHTGPYTSPVFGAAGMDQEYIDGVIAKTVAAVRRAYESLADAEMLTGRTECSTLAFNRRFWMKDGTVLTNPGKLNPDIVRPEGIIDPEIPLMAVKQDGMMRLIVANISNHTDTIGGDLVSADWPGRMERAIQDHFGYDIPVITLIAPQGNINHFNVENDFDQTNYAEACRIGKGYAAAVISSLYALKPVEVNELRVLSTEFEAPYVQVTDKEYNEAKAIVESIGKISATSADDLTSEGIAKGNAYVKKFFAQRLMECRDNPIKTKRVEIMSVLEFGRELAILAIPAEPFVEISLEIKKASPFKRTMVSALTQGEIGYIGLPECYERGGGYETRPSRGAPAHDLAPKIIETGINLINK
ncbi:MAG: hypothetical protein IJH79_16205 [Lentisphaeria bacterium]|nr:hypothetical protein [Lentisphaeria bacterium]